MYEKFPEVSTRPLSPAEMSEFRREDIIPGEVYEAFNEMIAENLRYGRATIKLKEVVKRLEEKGLNREEMFAKGMLDVEPIYGEAGWKDYFDRAGYNETYDSYYIFSVPK